jgi:hypothetical protein
VLQVATYREQKKMADKNRKLQEKAHRMKEESLRDDDNVFDVAFENQGGEAAEHTVSATDIKVCTTASHHSGQHMVAAPASSSSCSTHVPMYLPKHTHSQRQSCCGAAPVQHMLLLLQITCHPHVDMQAWLQTAHHA